jgi:hypothetical protein
MLRRAKLAILVTVLFAGCELDLPTDEMMGQGVISGTVSDTANVLVPNATIAVRGPTNRDIVAAAGVYSARQLAGGSYTVTIIPPQGWAMVQGTNTTVATQIVGSETRTINFKIRRQ